MRYATAVGHLRLVADACHEDAARSRRLAGEHRTPAILAAHAFGPILEAPDDLDGTEVAFVIDVSVDELPCGVSPRWLVAFASLTGIDRHPIRWWPRPHDVAVNDHRIRQPLLLWTLEDGVDEAAFDALHARRVAGHRAADPPFDALRSSLQRQLVTTEVALNDAIENYWEREWRSEHRGDGRHPEDALWDLAWGRRDLERGLEQLTAEAGG